MNDAVFESVTQDIVVEEVLPHAPEMIWKALTTGGLIARWLMEPIGFAAVKGQRFTFRTKAAGAWDGVINCEILEATPPQRLVYSWRGGHEGNDGYGSRLDTIVSFVLTNIEGGTRLRLVHSGFVAPKNDVAFKNMSEGWKKVVPRLGVVLDEA
jgi:uncharacterized protein YndB with AHSA1/START domain